MTQNKPPLVSVIIPVYNGASYLREAIESVLSQTLNDYELIIVDDGSTDDTPAIAQAYGTRIKYVRQDNRGAAAAFNHGIRLSSGRYISWLSHDDAFVETKLEMQLDAIGLSANLAVCYTDIQLIDTHGAVIRDWELPEHGPEQALRHIVTARGIRAAAYSLLYDRRCLDVVGMYDESRRYTQDADMLLRLARRFPLVHVPRKLVKVREHPDRGVRASAMHWEREAVSFYREWLERLGLEELFPELAGGADGLERAKARKWLGDAFVHRQFPFCWIALTQYREALHESPAIAPYLAPRVARLYWRSARQHVNWRHFRAGLTTLVRRRFGGVKP